MKRIVFLLILPFTTVCVSCSTLRGNLKGRDPWSGRFLHHSGKFELVLDHFDKDATIAKISIRELLYQISVMGLVKMKVYIGSSDEWSICSY